MNLKGSLGYKIIPKLLNVLPIFLLFQPYEAKRSRLLRQQILLLRNPSNLKQNHFSLIEGIPPQALTSLSDLKVTTRRL